jgi:hypothetical protein
MEFIAFVVGKIISLDQKMINEDGTPNQRFPKKILTNGVKSLKKRIILKSYL